MIDTSNHVYLEDSINEKSNKKIQIEDSDEDDALLTQALNAQEAKSIKESPPPPAKKVLIQSIKM